MNEYITIGHIEKQIDIDYDRMSRKVKYGQASRQSNLD